MQYILPNVSLIYKPHHFASLQCYFYLAKFGPLIFNQYITEFYSILIIRSELSTRISLVCQPLSEFSSDVVLSNYRFILSPHFAEFFDANFKPCHITPSLSDLVDTQRTWTPRTKGIPVDRYLTLKAPYFPCKSICL